MKNNLYLIIFKPRKAITLDTGFIIAASADIFCLVTEFPADKSTIAI